MKRSAKKSSAGNASCVATLYHLKRFCGTKCIKLNTWFRLKRFRGTKCGVHQILAVYDVRFGKGESDEISHAARAFSLLLAGGALARVMKLTAGGRGAFSFEDLTGVNVKSRLIKLVLLPLWYGNKDIIRDTLS